MSTRGQDAGAPQMAALAGDSAPHGQASISLPGFMMLFGSKAALTSLIKAIVAGSAAMERQPFLVNPRPCSPETVPPKGDAYLVDLPEQFPGLLRRRRLSIVREAHVHVAVSRVPEGDHGDAGLPGGSARVA